MLLDVDARCTINLIKHRRTDVVDLQVLDCLRKDVSGQKASATAKVNTVLEFLLDVEEPIRQTETNFFFHIVVSFDVFPKIGLRNEEIIATRSLV